MTAATLERGQADELADLGLVAPDGMELTPADLERLRKLAELEGQQIFGMTEPRLWTRPKRELTPATSEGFAAIDFAHDVLGITLLPWQEWWLIHALELKPDGTFRFGTILTLVSRQNGKTYLLVVLALYFLYVRGVRLVLGSAQKVDTAKESWEKAYELAEEIDELAAEFLHNQRGKPGRWDGSAGAEIRLVPVILPGGRKTKSAGNRRYKITAATGGAGRGLSVDLLILDEIRQQRDTKAWAALSKTTSARPNSIIVAISNAGDNSSVVLNTLRAAALSGASDSVAIFEWSAPDGCPIDDIQGWRQANPGLGFTVTLRSLGMSMITDTAEDFRTECMCQRVVALDLLFDENSWKLCRDPQMTLAEIPRRQVALCLDVAPDSQHATLVAAGVDEAGRVRLEVVARWTHETIGKLETDVTRWVAKVKPGAFGWFPAGPAAAYGSKLRDVRRSREITQVSEACQELVALVAQQRIRHADDPLLSAHVIGARKYDQGDGFRYVRKGAGHVDAAYAAAGAAKLAQSLTHRRGVFIA